MAVIETWFEQDLQKPVKVRYIDGNLFSHNDNGNRIGVIVTNNGEAVTLTGTVSGYAVLADGTTVPCTGTRSGNKASILVPAAAYSPGRILISIFLTDGTTVTTLAALSSSVIMARTGNQIDPGSVVTDWTNTINAAMQSVETAAANLGNIVATPYANLTFPVPLGKYTIYNNGLYRCISPIASSEAWTAAHWTNVKLGDDVADLKRALNTTYNIVEDRIGTHIEQSTNLMPIDAQTYTDAGVTAEYENGEVTFSGTGTSAKALLVAYFSLFPGTYTIRGIVKSGSAPVIRLWDLTGTTPSLINTDLRNNSYTFTTDKYTNYRLTTQTATNWTENSVVDIQLSEGDTATAFQQPTAGSAIDNVARAEIDKYSGIIEHSSNLLPVETQINVINGVTATYADGVLTMTGTPSATGVIPEVDFSLPAGTYTAIARFTQGVGDALKLINMTDNQSISSDLRNAVTFTLSNTKSIRIRSVMGSTSWTYNFTCEIMVNSGETALDFVAPSFVSAVDKVAREKLSGNPLTSRLTGKKLVTAGDSITYGDGASSANTTYGALAAKYLGMGYLNIAMSGRTMADIHVNGVTRNGFAVDRYLLVPDDTDYLTIFFGFNDGAYGKVSMEDDYCMEQYGKYYSQCTAEEKAEADAHADWFVVFVGTVDSTDKKTWCGAWRFVLDYFVNTKSIPHIGVFIPYGTDTRMTNPLKQLCQAFAVPYFDTTDVQMMPTIGFSYLAYQDVNAHNRALYTLDGLHPNDAGYVRMANAIIPWLERI